MTDVTMVVPCYNEAGRLRPEEFLCFARSADVRFVLVDDGSTDATRAILDDLARRDPEHFEVIALAHNRGQAEAVRTGIRLSLARGDALVGYWDADLAAPLEEIRGFVEVLERDRGCSVVFGSRAPFTHDRITRTWYRGLLGRLFAHTARSVHRLGVRDTQCGAKLFRNSPEVVEIFARPFHSRWIFDVEILARLIRIKGTHAEAERCVHELSLSSWRDVRGTKLKLRDFLVAPFEILRIRHDLRRV
jgi:glycosyltransferase involved in cell wall biosynthesis